jgi:hypothetical protein
MTAANKTYLELVQKLREEVGASGTGPTTVLNQEAEYARLVGFIADADLLIQELWEDWKFLHGNISITTTAGVREYSLSDLDSASDVSDISVTLQKWDPESFVYQPETDNAIPLSELEYKEWRSRERLGLPANLPQDSPSRVVIKPDFSLVFDPTPNSTGPITADFQKRPTRMTANADLSAIPAHYRRIIICRAKMLHAEYEETAFLYNSAERDYTDYLVRLESNQLPDGHWRRTSQMPLSDSVVRAE